MNIVANAILLEYWWLILAIAVLVVLGIFSSLRTVVPPNKIDIVIRKKKSGIYCSNKEYFMKPKRDEDGKIIPFTDDELKGIELKNTYFHIPQWVLGFGMVVRRLPLEMLEIKVPNFVAFDEKRARFECDIVAFCAIVDGVTASIRIPSGSENIGAIKRLQTQVQQVLWATMRDATTKMVVRDIINNRQKIIDMIRKPLRDALDEWGLGLKDIEIIEFKDAPQGKVITNISGIREQEIETEAREKNAQQIKKARLAEAESEEKARIREVERDELIEKREQEKLQVVAVERREATEKELDVQQVVKVKTQKIEKERAEVQAEQEKSVAKINADQKREVEKIIKEQKLLEGSGDKQRDQEKAKGIAAFSLEQGLADASVIKAKLIGEAEGKEKQQAALNKFKPEAIKAMSILAEIDKNKAIYTKLAESMALADTKLFMGGGKSGEQAFEFGKAMEGLITSSGSTGLATLNRIGQPNDLGFKNKDFVKMAIALNNNPELKKQFRKEIKKAKLADLNQKKTKKTSDNKESAKTQKSDDVDIDSSIENAKDSMKKLFDENDDFKEEY